MSTLPPVPPRRPQVPPKAVPRPPARRRIVIVQQDSDGPWKSISIFTLVALLVGAGFFFYLNRPRETPEPVVAKQPSSASPPVVPGPSVVAPEQPEQMPFVTKLRVVQVRKQDNPSQLDLKVWKINPTQKTPLRIPLDDTGRRREIRELVKQYEAIPFDKVVANPLAEDFPGAVPKEAARVVKALDLSRDIVGWHSTGTYAAPGELITIRINPGDRKLGMRAMIGCHRDDILNSKRESWRRFPRITRNVALTKSVTEIANPFGGPIYIIMPDDKSKSRERVRVEISGGVEAPYYKLGETNLAEWNHLRNAPAPWAELACNGIVLSVPSRLVRKLDNPEALMRVWQRVIEEQDWLAGINNRTRPDRIVPDRDISLGWMHSGYPIMCHLASASSLVNHRQLTRKDNWGFYHELGHNRQSRAWTFDGYVEVTCNFFALLCMDRIAGQKPWEKFKPARVEQAFVVLMNNPGSASYFDKLAQYVPVIQAFGWDPLRETIVSYRKKPFSNSGNSARKAEFVTRWSLHCRANLGPYFEKLGFPYTEEMKNRLRGLKEWSPPGFPPRGVKQTDKARNSSNQD